MSKLKSAALLVISYLAAIIPPLQAMHISCGKSFIPCENEPLPIKTRPRIYGISSAKFALQQVPGPLVFLIANEALREVHKFFNNSEINGINSEMPLSPSFRQYCHLHPMTEHARSFSESAFVSELMSLRLQNLGLRNIEVTQGLDSEILIKSALGSICPQTTSDSCQNAEYRPIGGACNNANNPLWGAEFEPLARLLPPTYNDGIMVPRQSKSNQILTNPREISLNLFEQPSGNQKVVNEMTAFWLYFIASDIAESIPNQALKSDGSFTPFPCCDPGFLHPDCDVISIPGKDNFYLQNGITCLPYVRSLPAPREFCKLGHREQINVVTSYLDGSSIYGSTDQQTAKLRTKADGLMRTSTFYNISDLLPLDPDSNVYCRPGSSRQDTPFSTKRKCFLSGTNDVNLLPEISALHTLFVRQHNRLAITLKGFNRHWDDEKIFNEARKIVVAQIQHITFNEFLPVLMGHDNIRDYKLKTPEFGYSGDYDVGVDATALNEFASIAVIAAFSLLNGNRRKSLSERFNNPDELYVIDGVEKIFNHLVTDPAEQPGLKLNSDFLGKFLKSANNKIGLDLAAMGLKQGRDHGLPTYTQIRKHCGLPRIFSFQDLSDVFTGDKIVSKIQALYESIDDVDLLVGVLAEKPQKGSFIGPTLACILGNQLYRTRTGDRYWYENFIPPSSFSEEQLAQIRQTTLSRLICNLVHPESIQLHAFMLPDNFENFPISCRSAVFPSMDMSVWKDLSTDLALPITENTIQKVVKLAELNLQEQNRRETSNIRKNQKIFKKGDPLFAYSNMMRAKPESKQINRLSAILHETTKILLRGQLLSDGEKIPSLDIENLQQILPKIDISRFVANYTAFLSENGQASQEECLPKKLPCDHTSRYRTYSGWCNNLRNPSFGNAFTPLRHFITPAYDDGFDKPRSTAVSGKELPNARVISNTVHENKDVNHVKFTHMVMQFGQFVDHELTHSPISRGPNDEILNCTRCDSPQTISVHCQPLLIRPDDPYFPSKNPDGTPRCLPFARSLLGQLNLGYRNQLNQLTAFIDASVIYGSTVCEANNLRLFTGGLMNYTDLLGDSNNIGLPQGNQEKDCRSLPHQPCFVAGDERNSHQPGLTVMHTLFMREHNRIAKKLALINPHWNDEKLFQETRRIHTAQFQHIVFNEFLPKLVGWDLLHQYDLVTLKTGYYENYDPTCDPAISHPFATAAYRFGHTLVRQLFPRMDFNYRNTSSVPVDLSQHFGHVGPIYNSTAGGIDTLLMGLLGTPSMAFDRHITNALRNQLFERRGQPKSGLDLISVNILRARDHGVPGYNAFRSLCGLKTATSFEDLLSEMDFGAIAALKRVYEHVDDIDLFPGITSERPKQGALLGTTMSCLLAEQFSRLKKCDRFYYENSNTAAKFTRPQLQEIRKMTLAKILCQTSKYIQTIQPAVFDMPDDLTNAQVKCEDLEGINLKEWREKANCEMNRQRVQIGETKAITPCVTCTCTGEGMECHPRRVHNCEKLLTQYSLSEVSKDTACLVQCADYLKNSSHKL